MYGSVLEFSLIGLLEPFPSFNILITVALYVLVSGGVRAPSLFF